MTKSNLKDDAAFDDTQKYNRVDRTEITDKIKEVPSKDDMPNILRAVKSAKISYYTVIAGVIGAIETQQVHEWPKELRIGISIFCLLGVGGYYYSILRDMLKIQGIAKKYSRNDPSTDCKTR